MDSQALLQAVMIYQGKVALRDALYRTMQASTDTPSDVESTGAYILASQEELRAGRRVLRELLTSNILERLESIHHN